ncbi:hypothetical protein KPL70_023897 [Citrus sinensis]|nr:hypothetical protein KPL70_023897 [Citrus sinensis]
MKLSNCAQTSSARKQLKDLRSLCLRVLSTVLNKYEDYDYDCYFWDFFFESVKPLIDAFKMEGSSSEKPSSMFSCFLAMSRSHWLVSHFRREKNQVPNIFSILTVKTASKAILSFILNWMMKTVLSKQFYFQILRHLSSACIISFRVQPSGSNDACLCIKDPISSGETARKIVNMLLPFLVSVKAVQVLRDILPVAGTESTKEVLNSLSPLLASAELDMR